MKSIAFVMIVLVLGVPSVGQAQMCFGNNASPECKTFWVTEFTYANQADGNISRGHLFSSELGLMFNLKNKHAVGGAGYVGFVHDSDWGDEPRVGVKGRYRYWLNANFNIDVAGGVTVSRPRVSLIEGHVFFQNWIGVGGSVEHWSEGFSRRSGKTVFYGSLKVGGWPGMSLTALTAALLAITWVSVISAG